jgi:chemotaxis protein methyltransferase CheR
MIDPTLLLRGGDAPGTVPQPTEAEFESFRTLIRRKAGIHLNASKRALLYGRLSRRIRELGLRNFGDYLARVQQDEAEHERMIDRITTNETRFFREPKHFAYLEERLLPRWIEAAATGSRPKEVRAWSAGCSTGEEPYSLAMVLLEGLPHHEGWNVEVLATDISTRVLEVARRATWPIDRAQEIPARLLKRFMLQGIGSQAGRLRAGPELRQVVRVEPSNLSDEASVIASRFDLIYCRNVLIYFEREHKQRVVRQLTSRLVPGGHLFVGHAEGIHGVSDLACAQPTVYAKRFAADEEGAV